ncbi:dTDP-glucose 4,6-dehydratase [Methanolobus vulcani]|uniref:dTDP-glucose 4,6-dehydratase n=1 Tax=Methanolobus vulcani TaxID=38026 RepID=A0A7Z8KMU5_9EURY|nr:dTDP-glucose 4,6-dehydratase [Methanolobus vulcani]TQD24056.1 dTDP-glucose 4,6-dehydratase [Methanolobus vulcani]
MNLLVTGAAGFIGSNFVYYMLCKYKTLSIIGLDKLTYAGNIDNLLKLSADQKNRFKFIQGDICNLELVQYLFDEYDFDGVINFAAESHVDNSINNPYIFLKTNVLGTQVLLNIAKKSWMVNGNWIQHKKFIQISTDEVYGTLDSTGYFTENTPLDPHNPYSASKAAADLVVKTYYDTYRMPINITRCSNNYGPYQFPEKLIPLMINNALKHQELPIYGDGKQIRDWLHVSDHCKAIDIVFEKGKIGEVYNIGCHNEKNNIYITRKIISCLRDKLNDSEINDGLIKHVKDRLGHDRRYAIDSTKIKKELGWEPTIKFDEGIESTIEWYLNNQKWIQNIEFK